ncbi:MAG: hypothetical protein EP341_09095 [Sphingomonadales bacterium]|nr:MAG: hypothetical protein EP341_09095 [Sphingomonadales bacterium]
MAKDRKSKWYDKAVNVWVAAAVVISIFDLFLILLLWNVSGGLEDVDSLAVSITVLEVFIAIAAIGGFWTLRSSARDAAAEEARSISEEVSKREVKEIAAPVARRAMIEYLALLEQKTGTEATTDGIIDMMQALDDGGSDA